MIFQDVFGGLSFHAISCYFMLFHVISCYCMFNGNVSLWYRLKPWHAWQYSGIRRIHSERAVLPKTPLRLAEIESTWPKDLERFWWTSRQALNFPPNFSHFLDLQPSSNPEPWQPMAKWQRIQNLRVLSHLSRSATAAIPKLDSCQKKLVEKEKPGNLVPKKLSDLWSKWNEQNEFNWKTLLRLMAPLARLTNPIHSQTS